MFNDKLDVSFLMLPATNVGHCTFSTTKICNYNPIGLNLVKILKTRRRPPDFCRNDQAITNFF